MVDIIVYTLEIVHRSSRDRKLGCIRNGHKLVAPLPGPGDRAMRRSEWPISVQCGWGRCERGGCRQLTDGAFPSLRPNQCIACLVVPPALVRSFACSLVRLFARLLTCICPRAAVDGHTAVVGAAFRGTGCPSEWSCRVSAAGRDVVHPDGRGRRCLSGRLEARCEKRATWSRQEQGQTFSVRLESGRC